MKTHKDLDVWNNAVELATKVYELTKMFPKEEIFGLTAQMRRAAVSIASNIAEGAARRGNKEFTHYLHMAAGSASELQTQLEIARRVGMANGADVENLQASTETISKMIFGLIRSVSDRSPITDHRSLPG
jgi:four helix bundle protein